MIVQVAESTLLGLDGHKLVKNMSIENQTFKEIIICGNFGIFTEKLLMSASTPFWVHCASNSMTGKVKLF